MIEVIGLSALVVHSFTFLFNSLHVVDTRAQTWHAQIVKVNILLVKYFFYQQINRFLIGRFYRNAFRFHTEFHEELLRLIRDEEIEFNTVSIYNYCLNGVARRALRW